MKTIKDLQSQLESLETGISELSAKRAAVIKELRIAETTFTNNKYKSYNLRDNSFMVLCAKETSEFITIRTLSIHSIDTERMTMICVEGGYTCYQEEFSFNIDPSVITFSKFNDLADRYFIYEVSTEQFKDVLYNLCSMEIDKSNFRSYQKKISDSCVRNIS